MKKKEEKTNAMRELEQKKIVFKTHSYVNTSAISGMEVASVLNEDPNYVFKTLVTTYNNKYYVCVIPVLKELDLKKAAKAFNVKSLEMVHVKDLLGITGYIRGGCSPIGMKKQFETIVDSSILSSNEIIFSGGKIGLQIEMNPNDLSKVIRVKFLSITREE